MVNGPCGNGNKTGSLRGMNFADATATASRGTSASTKYSSSGSCSGSGSMALTEDDAFRFLDVVREELKANPSACSDFYMIMRDLRSNRIDAATAVDSIQLLFQDNTKLILGFNQFLPPAYKIPVVDNDARIDDPAVYERAGGQAGAGANKHDDFSAACSSTRPARSNSEAEQAQVLADLFQQCRILE